MLKFLRNFVILLPILIGGVIFLSPKEPSDTTISFNAAALGPDLDAYLATQEARFDDITPGTQKRIIWAGEKGVQTDLAIIYLHGFSATSEEIRPVPDRVAAAQGANLFFTRLAGHGRPGIALSEPDLNDWVQDLAQAMEIGRRIGKKVVVVSTSTGATLAILGAGLGRWDDILAGLVLISPNFAPVDPMAQLAYWPLARQWVPLVAGEWTQWQPFNDAQRKFWTWRYQTVAVLPMMMLVKAVNALDLGKIMTPALFVYSENDQVVRPDLTAKKAAEWGGPKQIEKIVVGPEDSPGSHVLTGDIISPSQTESSIKLINDWIAGL